MYFVLRFVRIKTHKRIYTPDAKGQNWQTFPQALLVRSSRMALSMTQKTKLMAYRRIADVVRTVDIVLAETNLSYRTIQMPLKSDYYKWTNELIQNSGWLFEYRIQRGSRFQKTTPYYNIERQCSMKSPFFLFLEKLGNFPS